MNDKNNLWGRLRDRRVIAALAAFVIFSVISRYTAAEEPVETQPMDRLNDSSWRGDDMTWKEVFELQQKELNQGTAKCLMVGDSIIFRFRTTGKAVWQKELAPRNVVNLGIGSDRTEHVIWRLTHYNWSPVTPDRAFVLIGCNNYRASTAENIVAGNRRICEILQNEFPNIKIVVFELFPFRHINGPDSERQEVLRQEVNRLLRQEFAGNVSVNVVSLDSLFLGPDGTVAAETMPDGVHLSESAFQRWAEVITDIIDTGKIP